MNAPILLFSLFDFSAFLSSRRPVRHEGEVGVGRYVREALFGSFRKLNWAYVEFQCFLLLFFN